MQIAEYNAPVAERIVQAIKEKGLKQAFVAEKAGYTRQILNDMLSGRRLIKAYDIARISAVIGVDANYLFESKKGESKSENF